MPEVSPDIGISIAYFEADLKSTIAELSRFLPFEPGRVARMASDLRKMNARLVICDIAPIGISIANQAGIPAVLIENFIELNIPSIMLDWKRLSQGKWDNELSKLLALSRVKRTRPGGAHQVAQHLMGCI